MFIRICVKILPILFIINLYASEKDSSLVYYGLGSELLNLAKFERSEFYFKKAIYYSNDSILTAKCLNNLGIIFKRQGKYKQAYSTYIKAETYIKNKELLSKIYLNKGVIKKNIGDYEKAILLYRKAYQFTNEEKQKAYILNNISNVYFLQNNFSDALQNNQESLSIKKRIKDKEIYSAYLNIALCYQELKDTDNAELNFNKSIYECIRLLGDKHFYLIKAYANYGNFLIVQNEIKSFNLLLKANNLALVSYGEKHPETAKTFIYIGNYFLVRNENKKALQYYQKALIANNITFEATDIYNNPINDNTISELQQLEILHSKAIAFQKYANESGNKQKELKTSLKTYELAIKTLFNLQNSFMDESKRQLIAKNKDVFYKASEVALQLGDKMKSYELIESSKASTLLAELANQEAIKFSDIPETLAKKEVELKRMLFYHKAQENNDTLLNYQQKYDSLVDYLEGNYPKYYNLKYGKGGLNPQDHLEKDQVMLQFAVTDSVITTFVLTPNTINVLKLKTDSVFYGMTDIFLKNIRNYDVSKNYNEQYNEFVSSAYYLYARLIEPIDLEKGKSLIIVPDGIISYIPFEAFITKKSGDKDSYFSLDYLLYNHPVSYAYSARWLFDDYLGDSGKGAGAFAMDYRERDSLSAIFHGIPEAEKIKKQFGGKNYFNEECTSSNFIQHAGEYNILFLSLHGIINNKDGMQSYLPLFDRDLHTWEIYGMHFNARIAYLSACNTGDGNMDKGEGVMSMARAFAYAGCPTLISSLAAEYDNTPELTDLLFTLIKKGEPIDYALQQAKIKHIKGLHMAHPRIWANKIVMGKVTPIKKQANYLWLLPVGILLFALIYLKVNRYIF